MAYGTLKFDTLTTSDTKNTSTDKSIDTSYLFNGIIKHWQDSNNGTTITDSFNQSTLTDNGTGDYTFTFTNNMANDDYAFALAANNNDTGTGMVTGDSGHQTVVAVGSLKFSFTGSSSNSVTDTIIGSAMIIGDLA